MYCQNCGNQIDEGSLFCKNCGSAISAGQQSGMPYQGRKNAEINIFVLIASGLLAISVFLPYASVFGFSIALIKGDGIFFLIAAALGVIGALVKKKALIIIAGIAACVLSLIEVITFMKNEYGDIYSREIGFYLMILSSVFLLISAFIKRKSN